MKRSEGRKARQTVNGIIHTSLISMLSLFIFNSPGYGSPYIPVNVTDAPVTIEEAALSAGLDADSGQAGRVVITAVNGEVGSRAVFTLLAELQDGEAVHTETPHDIEPPYGMMLQPAPRAMTAVPSSPARLCGDVSCPGLTLPGYSDPQVIAAVR